MSMPTTFLLVASDGLGGSRDTPKTLRQVAFGVATFSMQILSDTSFKLQRIGFLGGQADRRFHEPSFEEPTKTSPSRRKDEHPNSDGCDARNGDLWSIVFQWIDGAQWLHRCHQGQVGPTAIKQNKIDFHHMLVNSSTDVVVEEAAKRLLPDMNLERKAKMAEGIGVGVAKRLALCARRIRRYLRT